MPVRSVKCFAYACLTAVFLLLSLRRALSRKRSGGERNLQVEAAGQGVHIEDFAREVEIFNALGFESRRVDFFYVHAASGDDGFVHTSEALYREREIFKKLYDILSFLRCHGMDGHIGGEVGKLKDLHAQRVEGEAVHAGEELLSLHLLEISEDAGFKLVFVQRGLQIDIQLNALCAVG